MKSKAIHLPDISIVDFNDPIEVESYVGLMVQAGNDMGAFLSEFKPNAQWNRICKTAKEVVKRLESLFSKMSPAQKMMSETAYDFAHRFAYSKAADSRFLDGHILEAFDAKIRGDESVDEYELYSSIDRRIRQRDHAFFDKPLLWNSIRLDDWLAHKDNPKSDYDRMCQVSIILNSRLDAYVNGNTDEYKQKLVDSNRYFFKKEFENLRDLLALERLLRSSFRYIPEEEYEQYRATITSALISHPDTNRFYRELLRARG